MKNVLTTLGKLLSRLLDVQLNRVSSFIMKNIALVLGIFTLFLIFFRALNQSLEGDQYSKFIALSKLGIFMIEHSNTPIYKFFINISIPMLFIYPFIIAPIATWISKIYMACEDNKKHENNVVVNNTKILKRITNNLLHEKYSINYGINNSYKDFYMEAFQSRKRLFVFNENIYIRIYVYPYITFNKIYHVLDEQIKETYHSYKNKSHFINTKGCTYIIPIYIFENADIQTKEYIIQQYRKESNKRIMPVVYVKEEDWWYHRRRKSPWILSIIKYLELTDEAKTKEDLNIWYEDTFFEFKGKGYSYFTEGMNDYENKKYKKALDNFRKATKLTKFDNDLCNTYFMMGNCYNELKLYQESIDAFNQVLSIKSNYNDVYHHLAVIYMKQKEFSQALNNFEIYLNKNPDDLYALVNCSCVHLKIKQYNLATKLLKQALVVSPKNGTILLHLIIAYTLKGDNVNSIKYMRQFQELRDLDDSAINQLVNGMIEEDYL
jgi:tetratricopeptide (TPR) repeat protein